MAKKAALRKHFRAVISFLLVTCLSPAVMNTQWPLGLNGPDAGHATILLTSTLAESALSVFTKEKQNKSNPFNSLYKNAFISNQIQFDFGCRRLLFLTGNNVAIVPRADLKAIPIRASPYFPSIYS